MFTKRASLFILSVVFGFLPTTAAADWCAGRAIGFYCDGSTLIFCTDQGTIGTSEYCPAGCSGTHPDASCNPYCGDNSCNNGETCETCAGDCGQCVCGDGTCQASENCRTCHQDCGRCPAECGDDSCDAWDDETCASCPEDCGECPAECGDGVCEGDETCQSCPQDCSCSTCGDDVCDGDEDCETCPEDCELCFCGNDTCQPQHGETCDSCPEDCGECPYSCGDDSCDLSETCDSCPEDCGPCICGDGVCQPSENCLTCHIDCERCPADCGNGECEVYGGETCDSCPTDCGLCECGDGICDRERGEECDRCVADCGSCWCPDGECNGDEDYISCEEDCTDGVCGDGHCNYGEDCPTCAADCPADCPPEEGYCQEFLDGRYCHGRILVTCHNGQIDQSSVCPTQCEEDPPQSRCTEAYCQNRKNGTWCRGDTKVLCNGGAIVSQTTCNHGCEHLDQNGADCDPALHDCVCLGSDCWSEGEACSCQASCLDITPEFCAGLADGQYCDQEQLLTCSDGQASDHITCPGGCSEDGASPHCADLICTDMPDDTRVCDGDTLVECHGGDIQHRVDCAFGCQMKKKLANQCNDGMCTPSESCESCPQDCSCNERCGDGSCQPQHGETCDTCPRDCGTCPCTPGTPYCTAACVAPPNQFCAGRADGYHCAADNLIFCQGQRIVGQEVCPYGCKREPGQQATCIVEDFCSEFVTDGSYCKGRTLVDCLGGERAAAQTCENGCIVTPEGKDDFCLSEDNPFCLDQPDGAWCYSGLLVTCQAQRPQAVFACPFGCIEQEDEDDRCRMVGDGDVDYNMEGNCARFSGSIDLSANGAMNIDNQRTFGVWPAHQLGNCPHPWGTIAKNGCTITSLAAIYEYLGFTRSVDGRQGMNCVYENAWRQEHGGYAPCAGEPEPNRCCAVWNTNPPGVGLYGIGNDGFNHPNCISGNAADALRLALNAGAPVLAGVVWEPVPSVSQAWHWITIVGADEQGLIMLDPWGGFKGRPADGSGLSLGREYRITTFRVPYMTSQMGGGGSNIDGAGRPVAGDDLVSEKPVSESSVADPDDPDDPDDPADPEGGSGGCSTSNSAGSGSFGWLLGLLGLAWLRRRRRFRG